MAVVWWCVVGVLLLLVELNHRAFFAVFAAAGCVAAGAVAGVAPHAVVAQAVVAVTVSVAGVVGVRPRLRKALETSRAGDHVARGVHGGLVGQQAITLDEVAGSDDKGHVRLAGERWLAYSGGDQPIPPGTPVLVTAVEGTTLVVWPVGTPSASSIEDSARPGDSGPGTASQG